jgi:hypothetical protein
MGPAYLMFFISFLSFAQMRPKIELIPGPKTAEDYEHQFKGCLENSECDLVMGLQLSRWGDLIKKIKDPQLETQKKSQLLELFREKYGIPVEFYTNQKSQQSFKPMLFDSHCKNHQLKNSPKILKGTAFLKSISSDSGIIWRDQTQIVIPLGESLRPQPVYAYLEKGSLLYQLPLGEEPLYMKNDKLYVIRESEEFFYMLSISAQGEWKIESADMENLSRWEIKRSEVPCPQDKIPVDERFFAVSFCKSIWHEDLKRNVTVRLHQGCVI